MTSYLPFWESAADALEADVADWFVWNGFILFNLLQRYTLLGYSKGNAAVGDFQ